MTEKLYHIANRHELPARACLPKNQIEVLMKKLLKLPLRLAALPLIAILLVFQLISSLIVGLTSIVTNLLATVFLFGSLAGWIANAPSGLIFQTVGLGIFFAFAPHIAGWLFHGCLLI